MVAAALVAIAGVLFYASLSVNSIIANTTTVAVLVFAAATVALHLTPSANYRITDNRAAWFSLVALVAILVMVSMTTVLRTLS
jgi:hypothetical protein